MAMIPLLRTLEALKNTPRRGWVLRGVPNPESVADHMYQMAMICVAYPWPNEADRAKAVEMAIVHDAPESIVGDITPADGVTQEAKHVREKLALDFLACLARKVDGGFANRLADLWEEYEAGKSLIAKIVHQVDKYEALQQAFTYAAQHPKLELGDFRSLRQQIADPWLAAQADEVLLEWDALKPGDDKSLPVIFVVGPPGVGKGTQCSLAAKELGFEHLSVGELLRVEQMSPGSSFGTFISASFQHSIPVPAVLAMMLLKRELEGAKARQRAGVLIDGFPRSVEQLGMFEEQISKQYVTIAMDCPEEDLVRRLKNRSTSSGRADDSPDCIRRRMRVAASSSEGILQLLSKNPLLKISCVGSTDDVQKLFRGVIEEITHAPIPPGAEL